MSHKRWIVWLLILLCALCLVQVTRAMSSANYRLDWFTPLTGGGGGTARSTNYAVNLTIGQAAIGGSSSAGYAAGLGYWYGVEWHGIEQPFQLYLPIVVK
jgi:hypothetical protein